MSELVRGTDAQQRRTLMRVGAVLAAVIAVVVAVVATRPAERPSGTLDVVLSTPTVGQGINVKSVVMLHGVTVGSVAAMDNRRGMVDLRIRLNRNQIRGLTDSFGFDFRPQNTFGVSALSITPRDGGRPLIDGQHIDRAPDINATMSQLLNSGIAVVTGVLTDDLVRYVRRATEYTAALAPLIETGLVLTSLVAETQRSTPADLLARFNDIVDPLPAVVDSSLSSAHSFRYLKGYEYPVGDIDVTVSFMTQIDKGLFGPLGDILSTHRTELTPTTEIARSFADAIATVVQRSRGSLRLDKALAGLSEIYNGPDSKRSVKFRLLLEPLPVLQSAMPQPSDLDGTGTR
ncbi:MlaD family protein [Mycobacteroides abscessus]|uniref:MlaD family protein n=1 Tax=Mycobacteroides abscessus TaxID=36809 RepID=UPI00092C0034|nr:MlaD family protein [Mycobacteroides abscessus]SHU87141.1 virulence factor Mce family protein [Mycobacteroides abscessus subsp. bolletii]SHW22225.1 virulence factor Mce family protein [Mycobacteroides abscessus subsp. bolletii]SHW47302.1 virulence factor Mce family protein [Mycobacteroides abscessus subsp. bolletii]SHX91771.1 virulence factor Mce family protein [Mycobacteroides abscessus subsp. bolletii]SKS69334.1 virulence factor Mce family protein [Mycobacteroides abscessus subsp. bolleti